MCVLVLKNRRGCWVRAIFDMFWDFFYAARAWWHKNKNTPIALQRALFVIMLAATIAFVVGRVRPETDYRRLQLQNRELRENVREFALVREQNESAIRRAKLATALGDKSAARLRQRIGELTAENLRRSEEAIFYRRALGAESQSALNVYALESTPDFRPGEHLLSAVLIFPQTQFSGGYYFEIITTAEPTIVRVPTEDNVLLELDSYAEIEQVVVLPDGAEIGKLRLVVEDANGDVQAEAVIETESVTETELAIETAEEIEAEDN